jgi:hypothetical protein
VCAMVNVKLSRCQESGAATVNYLKIKFITKIDRAYCGRLECLDMHFISLSLLAREVQLEYVFYND